MAMDELFDLDLALTMEVTNNISISSSCPDDQISKSSKSKESEAINNIMGYTCTTRPSIPSVAGTVCTVCMEGFESSNAVAGGGGGAEQVRCGHIYHANCITKWLSLHHSCPLCRSPILFRSPENYSSTCNT